MNIAPPQYLDLLSRIVAALAPQPRPKPLLIGLDGRDGSGKTSLAAWLAWQLGIPAVFLDLYIIPDSPRLTWRTNDLARVLDARLRPEAPRPVIVEGILLLDALESIGRKPDYLVYVEKHGNEGAYYLGKEAVTPYMRRRRPEALADYVLRWEAPD
jgi:uridine kinase